MPAYLQNLSADTQTRTLQLLEALARHVGLLPPLPQGPPPPPPVPTITKSIGTTGRDYSTITAWEADLDNGAIYASGDTALGECYDDSAFDESVTINGGGTVGLAAITLTAAVGERHDGTVGTGARIERSTFASLFTVGRVAGISYEISWLEMTVAPTTGNAEATIITWSNTVDAPSLVANCLIHDISRTSGTLNRPVIGITVQFRDISVQNSIIYAITNDSTTTGENRTVAIDITGTGTRPRNILNNTIHDITKVAPSASDVNAYGIRSLQSTAVQNNLVTGTAVCFSLSSTGTESHNAASDTTAAGTGSIDSIVTADQYVSTTGGSEDLHLKAGADCIDAGTDLGTTPTGVNIDIDGRDRDAMTDTWDIGADEYVAVGGGFLHPPLARLLVPLHRAANF